MAMPALAMSMSRHVELVTLPPRGSGVESFKAMPA